MASDLTCDHGDRSDRGFPTEDWVGKRVLYICAVNAVRGGAIVSLLVSLAMDMAPRFKTKWVACMGVGSITAGPDNFEHQPTVVPVAPNIREYGTVEGTFSKERKWPRSSCRAMGA